MPSPQRIRWAKFRSAVVAVVALLILSVLVWLLTGGTWLKPKTYLTTYIPDSTGIAPNADVELNGVLVGKVSSVRLTHSRVPSRVVEVRLRVLQDSLRNIPEDSVTELDSANLLGDKYIDILMGRSPQPVRANGVLAYRQPSGMMQNIDLAQFAAQLKTIDQTIIDIQAGKGSLGQFVVNDDLYRKFLDGVNNVGKKVHAAKGTQSQLGQILYSATKHDELRQSLRRLDDRLAQIQQSQLLRDSSQSSDVIVEIRRMEALDQVWLEKLSEIKPAASQ